MLIRPDQMEAFSANSTNAFESDMVSHLNRCFPAECAALGETRVRVTIRDGIELARGYGITASREVCTYIDLMIVFGHDFDHDPKLPWAASILNGTGKKDAAGRVDRLYEAAQRHYKQRKGDVL